MTYLKTTGLTACLLCIFGVSVLSACQPTVKIQAPDKPIVINMNINIKEEVRVKMDRDVKDLLQENDDIF